MIRTTIHIIIPLAQDTQQGFSEILRWGVILIVLVLAGWILIAILRRRLKAGDASRHGYTIQDLRDMHASGKLTEEEFARAKRSIIEQAGSATSENHGRSQPHHHDDSVG